MLSLSENYNLEEIPEMSSLKLLEWFNLDKCPALQKPEGFN